MDYMLANEHNKKKLNKVPQYEQQQQKKLIVGNLKYEAVLSEKKFIILVMTPKIPYDIFV